MVQVVSLPVYAVQLGVDVAVALSSNRATTSQPDVPALLAVAPP